MPVMMRADDKFAKLSAGSLVKDRAPGEFDDLIVKAHRSEKYDKVYAYKGTPVDGMYYSDDDYYSFMVRSVYNYLRGLAKKGRYDILRTCIRIAGKRYTDGMASMYDSTAQLKIDRESGTSEKEGKVTVSCYILACITAKRFLDYSETELTDYILSTGKEKYKKLWDYVNRITEERNGKEPDSEPSDQIVHYTKELYRKIIHNIPTRYASSEESVYLVLIGLTKQEKGDPFGLIQYGVLLGDDAVDNWFQSPMNVYPDESEEAWFDDSGTMTEMLKAQTEGYDQKEKNWNKTVARVARLHIKLYSKYLGYTVDEIPGCFLGTSVFTAGIMKDAVRKIMFCHGLRTEWYDELDETDPENLVGEAAISNEEFLAYYVLAIIESYLSQKMQTKIREEKNIANKLGMPDVSVDVTKDVMEMAGGDILHLLDTDDTSIAEEIADICSLIRAGMFIKIIADRKKEEYRNFDFSEYEEKEDSIGHIENVKRLSEEKTEENQKLRAEKEALQKEIERLRNKDRAFTQVIRHEKKSAVQNRLEKAEEESKQYKELYEEAKAYIDALEAPEEPVEEIKDAARIAREKLAGKRFMFVSHDAGKSIPNAKNDFPGCVFIENVNDNMNGLKLDGIVVMIKHVTHSLYYKLMKYCHEQYGDVPVLLFNYRNEKLLYSEMLRTFGTDDKE